VSAEPSGKLHRVGWLSPGLTADPKFPLWVAFMEGFRDLGYVEGQNLMLEGRFAGGDLERLPVLARELVAMSIEVLVVFGPTPMRAAQAAAQGVVPIVMVAGSSDPVAEGYVASFARPGTNVTGLTYAVSAERFGKQLEFLKEAISVSRVALLWDGTIEIFNRSWAPALNEAARILGLEIEGPFLIRAPEELERTFADMAARQVQAVLVASSGALGQSSDRLAEVALRHWMPVMAAFREFTEAGILMSYGPNMPAIYRRAAVFVDKILKGTPPGEIPVEQPVSHDLIINLKTARALGLTLPPAIIARADEVIE
jgi:putative ABC transport system substrate-binding protein